MKNARKSRYLQLNTQQAVRVRGPLAVVDNQPIRQQAITEHDESKRLFLQLQDHINRYHNEDKPRFQQWLQENFGLLVRELHTTRGEAAQLRELIFEVETRTWLNNQSCAAAYRDVLERRARRQENTASPEDLNDLEEKLKARMKSDASAEDDEVSAPAPSHAAHKLSPEKLARLKSAYRSLARRFHPDSNANLTPAMLEFWYEAQRAYMAGDVELLESMESSTQSPENKLNLSCAISLIRERTIQLREHHQQLRGKLVSLKKEPDWGFTKLRSTTKLQRHMAKELPKEIAELRLEIKELNQKIKTWQSDAERFYPGFKEKHGAAATKPKKVRPVKKTVRSSPEKNSSSRGDTSPPSSFSSRSRSASKSR